MPLKVPVFVAAPTLLVGSLTSSAWRLSRGGARVEHLDEEAIIHVTIVTMRNGGVLLAPNAGLEPKTS